MSVSHQRKPVCQQLCQLRENQLLIHCCLGTDVVLILHHRGQHIIPVVVNMDFGLTSDHLHTLVNAA